MAPLQTPPPRLRLSEPVIVGKDILELLSSAMYVDPLSIFREYVQNAADSLDEASDLSQCRNAPPGIHITLDPVARSTTIRDTGAGVPRTSFIRTLTSIGGSRKRGTTARGFRGVGRLAGLGYCQHLVMRSKAQNDDHVSLMYWDCRRLKEILRDPAHLTLDQILHEIVEIDKLPPDGFPSHFFEVELRNVLRYKNDLLLNEVALENYLAQVAPVPFHPSFSFGATIEHYLAEHNAAKSYKLTLNGRPIYRPFRDSYEARPNVHCKFTQLAFFQVPGLSTGTDAVGWILNSDYLGAIPDRHGIKGIRARVGNIQIGDCRILDSAFPEARFNAWTVGECHVLSPKLVPNARRDDFEQNTHHSNLLGHLAPKAREVARACRDSSIARARQREQALAAHKEATGANINWSHAKLFVTQNAAKRLSQNHRETLKKLLSAAPPTYAEVLGAIFNQPEPSE